MAAMARSSFYGFTEYGTVGRIVGAGCGVILCFYYVNGDLCGEYYVYGDLDSNTEGEVHWVAVNNSLDV